MKRAVYIDREARERYEKVTNWQSIKEYVTIKSFEARFYITYEGNKVFIDDFLRTGTPWNMWDDSTLIAPKGHEKEDAQIIGIEPETYYKPLFLVIDRETDKYCLMRYLGKVN